MEVTRDISALPPDDSTRDADLGVTPQLLSEDPNLSEKMQALGHEAVRQDRPGVWTPILQRERTINMRDSIDLMAPMMLARDGLTSQRAIRSARVGTHGRHAVSATHGTELTTVDRQLMTLRAFDEGREVDAYVAGPTALLVAKAYKIRDRLDPAELRRNAARLRPKDYADMYRLLLAVPPEEAASVCRRGLADSRLREAVATGRQYLLDVLADSANAASMVADVWGDPSREREFRAEIGQWHRRFMQA